MIPDKEPVNNWNGNSSNVNFDFDFLINSEDELLVLHTDAAGIQTTLKLNIDYTINQTGNADGSYITFPILGSSYKTLGDDEKITLMLNIPIAQTSPYGTSAKLNLKSLEFSLDYIVRLIQMVNRKADRSVKVQEGSENTPDDLIESLNQAQINAENSANFAATKAQEANNSAIKAEEQVEIATQNVEKSKNWAIKLDGPVENQEYSSKYNANIAKEKAEICEIKTSELTSNFNQYSYSLLKAVKDGITSLSNVSNALRHTQITNCILEASKNIKLEFDSASGKITLKTGSVLVVPNGTDIFDYITTDIDVSVTDSYSYTGDIMLFAKITDNKVTSIYSEILKKCTSGDTKPTVSEQYHTWYDTKENKVKRTSASGATWQEGYSFPLALLSYNNKIQNIKQIFDYVGFIGNSIFIHKGLKVLISNGRNLNSTLNNTVKTLDDDKIINFASIGSSSTFAVVYIYNNTANYCPASEVYRISTKPAANAAANQIWFDEINNKVYYSAYQAEEWTETTDLAIIATINVTDATINSLIEEQPVELVKRSDTAWIINSIAPDFNNTDNLPTTLDLVQVADLDCYLNLVTGSGVDMTVSACDKNGENEIPLIVADSTVQVALGGISCLLRKGQYFKVAYLAGGKPTSFKKIYTIGGTNV